MSSKIRVLSEHTINKIAAGEVIENPASVVKELVENSIDAGATEICIEIKGGGRQLIRITDNGCGMNADDALLCLERHATSKIKEVEDIHSITTMGFRGEAIPSIASISKFTLLTCPQEPPQEGTMVIVDGGRLIQCAPAARSPGTTIEVKSLFFNVPVRKNFLKSPAHDVQEILKIVSVIALGYPGIKFQLINNQSSALLANVSQENLDEDKLGQRLIEVLGKDFFLGVCPIDEKREGYHLTGFIGLPSHTRPNRTGQYLFINHRAVQSPLVSFSVREGYATTLAPNRHPLYVLHLTLPGSLVDVNVHPQKREVRLRQEQVLKDLIREGVQKALQHAGALTPWDSRYAFESDRPPDTQAQTNVTNIPLQPYVSPVFTMQPQTLPEVQSKPFVTREPIQEQELFSMPQKAKIAPRVLATLEKYILVDSSTFPEKAFLKGGFCLVEQKAAHSRIIFERLLQKTESENAPLAIQRLLIPYTLEATPLEATLLRDNLEGLNKLGMEIHEIGPNAFIVDALPQIFGNADLQTLISNLVHGLQEFQENRILQKEKIKHIALAASRAAVSSEKKLSITEAQTLVNQLMECQTPYFCPQGKPTIAYVSSDELNKQFMKFACQETAKEF